MNNGKELIQMQLHQIQHIIIIIIFFKYIMASKYSTSISVVAFMELLRVAAN